MSHSRIVAKKKRETLAKLRDIVTVSCAEICAVLLQVHNIACVGYCLWDGAQQEEERQI